MTAILILKNFNVMDLCLRIMSLHDNYVKEETRFTFESYSTNIYLVYF